MATKNQMPEVTPEGVHEPERHKAPELLEIGELGDKHNIGRAIFAGMCAAQDWKPGKKIGEEEFLEAVSAFTGAPMNGCKLATKESEGKSNA